jgi:hypothetical protein
MFYRAIMALLCLALLAACESGGGSVLESEEPAEDDDPTDDGEPIDSPAELPPGTASPSPDASIFRTEPFDAETGNGFANSFAYDADTDTFFVDGLAFDGSQPDGVPYSRATPGSLGPFALYEAPATFEDPIDGDPIGQFTHRALYGVSDSGQTEFAIVRTGSYVEYGFGGFIYQRNGDVVLPEEGQARYTGDYAGVRDFEGRGGLEYVTGDTQIDIDFRGFRNNCEGTVCADAVRGYVFNRTIYDVDGNDVTQSYLDSLGEANDGTVSDVPVLQYRIGPNVMTPDGEMTGEVFSQAQVIRDDGTLESVPLDEGNYYAVLAGDHTSAPGGEVVGVVVVESDDPRFDGTVRETGGFLVNR